MVIVRRDAPLFLLCLPHDSKDSLRWKWWVVGIQLYEFCKIQGKIVWGNLSLSNFVHNGMTRECLVSSNDSSLRPCHSRACTVLFKEESAIKIQEMHLLGLDSKYKWIWTHKHLQFWRNLLRDGTIPYSVAGYKGSPWNAFNFLVFLLSWNVILCMFWLHLMYMSTTQIRYNTSEVFFFSLTWGHVIAPLSVRECWIY